MLLFLLLLLLLLVAVAVWNSHFAASATGVLTYEDILQQDYPVWGEHSCIDCLLSMRILLPRTSTREKI